MKIVSISLPERTIEDIEYLKDNIGFSGRSEIVRAGIRSLIENQKVFSDLTGQINPILLIKHNTPSEWSFTSTVHKYDDIITTHIHNRLEKNNCLEILILKGDTARIQDMFNDLQTNKKLDYVKLIPA